jgi:glycosyltransferase involved in cell wall biosynthesis
VRVLWLAVNFPTSAESSDGAFNVERILGLRKHCGIESKVISPVGVVPPEDLIRRPTMAALQHWWDQASGPRTHEWIEGIEVWRPRWVYPPKRWFWRFESSWLTAQVARTAAAVSGRFQPEVLQASRALPEAVAAARLGRRLGLPVAAIAEGSELMKSLPREARRESLVAELNGGVDALIYVSEALRSAGHALGLSHPLERIVWNGVDTARFQRLSGPRPSEQATIISVGNLYRVKGHDLLLRALPLVQARSNRIVKLRIVGDGPERGALQALALSLGLHDAVEFVGKVPNRLVPDLYRAATLGCLPSRSEGLPVSALEAMACGLPVVATRVGGLPEIVREGVTGVLVGPESPAELAGGLVKALSRPWDGETIRNVVKERFSMELMAQRLADVYREIVREGASPQRSRNGG